MEPGREVTRRVQVDHAVLREEVLSVRGQIWRQRQDPPVEKAGQDLPLLLVD